MHLLTDVCHKLAWTSTNMQLNMTYKHKQLVERDWFATKRQDRTTWAPSFWASLFCWEIWNKIGLCIVELKCVFKGPPTDSMSTSRLLILTVRQVQFQLTQYGTIWGVRTIYPFPVLSHYFVILCDQSGRGIIKWQFRQFPPFREECNFLPSASKH